MSLTPIPVWMKQEVLARDGWNCLRCGIMCRRYPDGKVRPDTLTFDHIVPECKRGMTTVDNLQVLCCQCNRRKGDRCWDYRRPEVRTLPPAEIVGHEPRTWALVAAAVWLVYGLIGLAVVGSAYGSTVGALGFVAWAVVLMVLCCSFRRAVYRLTLPPLAPVPELRYLPTGGITAEEAQRVLRETDLRYQTITG